VAGAVQIPLTTSLPQLRQMEKKTVVVTLECAGNGRTRMQPAPPSTPWQDGALATAQWTGVSLRDLIEQAGPKEESVEVLFVGADAGLEAGRDLVFERSLPITEALREEVILAYEMNGHPLPKIHGYPLRLIVPGWYGMASVKWLTEIRVLTLPFQGYYQKERYVYSEAPQAPSPPVNRIRVKSLILEPVEQSTLKRGKSYMVTGLAWSGWGKVTKVQFRTHNSDWRDAQLNGLDLGPYAWRRWSVPWTPERRGRYVLLSRACDETGGQQPKEPVWNLHGYGYNTISTRTVRVQ
jgi:DMSO/TMAO reductase YedYZ molybdopterin-dependent catalytic subunit